MQENNIVQIATEIDGSMEDVRKYFHMAEVLMRQPLFLKSGIGIKATDIDSLSDDVLLKSTQYVASFSPVGLYGNISDVKISKADKSDKYLISLTGVDSADKSERNSFEPLFKLAELYGSSDILVSSPKKGNYRISYGKRDNCKEIADIYSSYSLQLNNLAMCANSLQHEYMDNGWTEKNIKKWKECNKLVVEAVQKSLEDEKISKNLMYQYGDITLYDDTPNQIFQEKLLFTYLSETNNGKNSMSISDFCTNLVENHEYADNYYHRSSESNLKFHYEPVEINFLSKTFKIYKQLYAEKLKADRINNEIARLVKEGWDGKTPLTFKGQNISNENNVDTSRFEAKVTVPLTKSGKPKLVNGVDYKDTNYRAVLDAVAVQEKTSAKGKKFYSTTSLDGTVKYHIPHFLLKPYKVDEKGNPLSYYYTTSNNAVTVQRFEYNNKEKHFVPTTRVSLKELYKHFSEAMATSKENYNVFKNQIAKTEKILSDLHKSNER